MHRQFYWLAGILLFLGIFLAPAAARGTVIELKKEALVAGEAVRLEDVASIAGASSESESAALKTVVICAAPPPAENQIISSADVVSAIARSTGIPSGLAISGAKETLVRRAYDELGADELIDAFREYVARKTGWEPGTFAITPPKNLRPVPVPQGKRELVISTQPNEKFSGSVSADFTLLINKKPYETCNHRFMVDQYVRTLVAAEKIKRGQLAGECNFDVTTLERSKVDGEPVSDIEQLDGMRAVRTIFPGTPVSADYFATAPVVKRGETVSVMWAGTGFNIVTKGLVLENGHPNDIVRTRVTSKKILRTRVMDSETVQIVN